MRTAVFDLDGTLVDTSYDMLGAANAAFEARGLGSPLEHPRDAATAMAGGRAMLALGSQRLGLDMAQSEIDAWYPEFLESYSEHLHVRSYLYDGVVEAIGRLAEAGWALAICTNKPTALAERLMQSLEFRTPFGALIGADTLPVRKPDPAPLFEAIAQVGGDPGRSVLIGDTVTDRTTAERAGVPSVLVTFGPTGEAVAKFAPEALLAGYWELEMVLDGVVP